MFSIAHFKNFVKILFQSQDIRIWSVFCWFLKTVNFHKPGYCTESFNLWLCLPNAWFDFLTSELIFRMREHVGDSEVHVFDGCIDLLIKCVNWFIEYANMFVESGILLLDVRADLLDCGTEWSIEWSRILAVMAAQSWGYSGLHAVRLSNHSCINFRLQWKTFLQF